jgi:RNA polymerase sigma-70 factor (ECF subfamily)
MLLHAGDEPLEEGPVTDDRLRPIFTCCHPSLDRAAQVALMLRYVSPIDVDRLRR